MFPHTRNICSLFSLTYIQETLADLVLKEKKKKNRRNLYEGMAFELGNTQHLACERNWVYPPAPQKQERAGKCGPLIQLPVKTFITAQSM